MQRSSQQEIRLLHVDDEPSITDLTATFLEREDDQFSVETAASADEGLELVGDRPPDCIVSDYNMPGMDGLEFLQAVREEYPDLPFILFTGRGSEEVASEAIATGVTDYIQKGSGSETYELLATRIRNAVNARREAKRADRQEQLMRLTEFAGDTGGFELDVDSGNLILTDGTRRLVGLADDAHLSLEEAIEFYHPDDQADVRETINGATETGKQTRGTWRLQTLDGDERLVDVTIMPAAEGDDVTTLRGAVHDITERRERRQELEQIETVFNNAQDGLFLMNADEGFTTERVNPAYEEVRGVPAEEVRGQPLREVLGERAGAVAERQCRECVERKESLELERTLQREGEQTHYVTRIAPVVVDGSVEYIAGSLRDVTAQRERQEELRRLQQAIDGANVPITLADPSKEDDPLVYVNDAFEDVTGYPPEEALGRNCRFLQGEGTDPEKVTALREAIDDEEPISLELRNYRKDGTEFWNRLTLTPIYDDAGDLVRYLGTQEDITERKERERELGAERQFIEQALDTLDDLFYVLDTDGTLRRWNDRLPEITGYTDGELAEMDAIELFPEDEGETIVGAIETTLADGEATVEADLRTADGDRRPYEFTGAQLTDEDGTVTGLVGVGRDLRDRRQRERRFRALVEESNDVISIVDTDGVFRYQSPSIERILGYEPEETVGDMAWEYVHPDDRADLIEAFERGIADPDANPVMEYRARHADGSWRWLEARGNNQLDNPAVEGYIINSRDVTGRKNRERELERTRDLVSDMEQLADIGAWEYDPGTNETTHTAGELRIYGIGPETDLQLDEAFDFYHRDDTNRLRERFRECVETGEPYETDVRVKRADGEQRWVRARGERVGDSGPDSVVRGYVRDITEEKTREQQLTELNRVTEDLLTAKTRQEVADIGVQAAKDVLNFRANAVHLSGADDTRLAPVARTDALLALLDEVPALPVADSIAGRAYRQGEPIVTEDARQEQDVYHSETDCRGHLYLPLGDHGVLIAGSKEPAVFDEQHLALGELLAGTLAAAFDRIDREQTARRRQEQLSLFFEESPLGAIQWDDEFRFGRMNDRAEEILGYSETELRGEPWGRIVADDDHERVGDAVESLLDADGGRRVINDNVRKDGETLTCEWHNRAVTDADGNVKSVFSKFQDVTDRERRKRELREYETIIEALSDAVYVVDENGRFRYVNDEFVELVGYDRETVVGNTPSLIKDDDSVRRAEHQLSRLLSSDGPSTVMFEVTIQPRTGDPIVCEDHMGVLPYDGERFDGSVGVLRDITEHKQYERELEAQNERLNEFASIVSHDLRSPLGVAEGHLELAGSTDENEHLAEAVDAIERSQALIDDLLTLAREGDHVAEIEPVDLAEVAQESWDTAETGRATLDAGGPTVIEGDRSRIQQLIENLCRNAVEHGGEEVTVHVGAMDGGFYVADTGSGIPESAREEIFDAGYSTADDGTGFGLRIVEQIVDAHGWEVSVTEGEQGGARFEFTGVETPE